MKKFVLVLTAVLFLFCTGCDEVEHECYDSGYEDGREEGYDEGYYEGYYEGLIEGLEDEENFKDVYDQGYFEGYADGLDGVFYTSKGAHYHLKYCSEIEGSPTKRAITVSGALNRGLTPCDICSSAFLTN